MLLRQVELPEQRAVARVAAKRIEPGLDPQIDHGGLAIGACSLEQRKRSVAISETGLRERREVPRHPR